MSVIPEPPKVKVLKKDERKELLIAWKKLFEDIDPSIRAYHMYEEDFRNNEERIFAVSDSDFGLSNKRVLFVQFENWEIVPDLDYLCGMEEDEMFSQQDIDNDDLYQNEDYPCEPHTKKWEEWYKEICDIVANYRTRIPAPPQK